jgi:hypothetical protein
VRETKQSRDVKVRLTVLSSQFVKFDTILAKKVMNAYTKDNLTLPFLIVDKIPFAVELLTYDDKPRWATV